MLPEALFTSGIVLQNEATEYVLGGKVNGMHRNLRGKILGGNVGQDRELQICTKSNILCNSLRECGAGALRREPACGRGVEPAFVLQDLMHSRLPGCKDDGVEGQLEQTPTAACACEACARARSLRIPAGLGPQRPPISTAKTTGRHRGECVNSG